MCSSAAHISRIAFPFLSSCSQSQVSTVVPCAYEFSPWIRTFGEPQHKHLGCPSVIVSPLSALPHSFQPFQLPQTLIFATSVQQDHHTLLGLQLIVSYLGNCPQAYHWGDFTAQVLSFLSLRSCSSCTIVQYLKTVASSIFLFLFNSCLWQRKSLLPDISIRSLPK